MEVDVEEIIRNTRNAYEAAEYKTSELQKQLAGQAIKSAFDISFAKHFSDFPLDKERPEVLSCNDDRHLVGGDISIRDIDTGAFENERVLYPAMSEAESWVSQNIDMIECLVEKQDLAEDIDQDNINSQGL